MMRKKENEDAHTEGNKNETAQTETVTNSQFRDVLRTNIVEIIQISRSVF